MLSYQPRGTLGRTESLWPLASRAGYPTLETDLSCEICVIGAGISGLAVAYELTRRGHDVVVLDSGPPGAGETSRSTAHLVTALDERYFALEDRFGPEVTRSAATSHAHAIDWLEATIGREAIECGFARVNGSLVVPRDRASDASALLDRELAAASRAGLKPRLATASDVMTEWFPDAALVFPDQAQVEPVALAQGLAAALLRHGGKLLGHSRVDALERGRFAHTARTDRGHNVRAKAIVLATHELPGDIRERVRRMWPIVSFVTTFEVTGPHAAATPSLLWDGYWDRDDPYHYVRWACAGDGANATPLLLVGGEDQSDREPTNPYAAYAALAEWARVHFPFIGPQRHAWWGRIFEPEGEFALVGQVPGMRRVYVVAGDSGNGMTYAALAAERLADTIESKPRPAVEDELYNPAPR